MKRVIRNITLDCARDLLERAPRACITFAGEHGPQAQPVVLLRHEPRYVVGIPVQAEQRPDSGQEVVLLIDEGVYFFDVTAGFYESQAGPTCEQTRRHSVPIFSR